MYTKTGDQGTSSLYNGERRSKTDSIFQALGDVDELNSTVGVAREFAQERLQEGMEFGIIASQVQTLSSLVPAMSPRAEILLKSSCHLVPSLRLMVY